MNLRKAVAKVVAVLMILISIPVFASSTNGVNKVITVREGATIEEALAPELGIELKDKLEKGQYFYLDLTNAQWIQDIVAKLGVDPNFTYERESSTRLVVQAKRDVIAQATPYRIPLISKITGSLAKVEIISNGTVVTSGQYAFANAVNIQSIVTAEPKVFASKGEMGEISIEEQYLGAFKSNKPQTLIVEIMTQGFEFDYNKGQVISKALKGKRSYDNKEFDAKIISPTTLEVVIPANSLDASQRGLLELSRIRLKSTIDATYGDINVKVSGDLSETINIVAAKYGDYATELTAEDQYEVIAGQPLDDVTFTLGEVLPESFYGNREITFTFSEGITIEELAITSSKGILTGAASPVETIIKKDNKNTNAFTVANIIPDKLKNTSVSFRASLKVPTTFTGNIILTAEGRSLEEKKQLTIAKVQTPIRVAVTPITAQVGLAQQIGPKIVITETSKGNLLPGKLFLAFADDVIKYKKAPEVKVVGGNIKLAPEATIVDGGLEITINGKSREAATIEISGGEFSVPGLIPEGTYRLKVGGPSISAYSSDVIWDSVKGRYNEIDAITEQDYIYLGTKATANKAIFIIGNTKYSVNGVEMAMDTAAYLAKEGRTMLPVRYVADALGIPSNQILWDAEEKVVTILVNKDKSLDKIIQIKLGDKAMIMNNVKSEMTATAEMKDNRVFVPVAEIARALGSQVQWDPDLQIVTFN